jgi:hypothetical protein
MKTSLLITAVLCFGFGILMCFGCASQSDCEFICYSQETHKVYVTGGGTEEVRYEYKSDKKFLHNDKTDFDPTGNHNYVTIDSCYLLRH